MNTSVKIISEIVDFAIKHASYYKKVEREELERYAALHARYRTLLVIRDKKGISAVARWNVLPSRDTLHIIDVIVRPDLRSVLILRKIAIEIWKTNPSTKYFYYERAKKNGAAYGYSLKQWFKLKEKSHGREILSSGN